MCRTSPLIKISDIADINIVQGDEGNKVVEDLVIDGIENLFSKKIILYEGYVISEKNYNREMASTCIPLFFIYNEPKIVIIQGNVDLIFVKRCKFKEINYDEIEEGKF